MDFDLNLTTILILSVVALVAGFVDSIAGGGGMITIPALMFAGIPPHEALGTNKFQAVFGSFSATLHFWRKGYLQWRKCALFATFAFVFALGGTLAVQVINADILRKAIPFLLMFFALYFLFSPKVSEESSKARIGKIALAFIVGGIGFYDGFFGPGTGSFLMIALISLGGFGIKDALAQAKLYNFATNFASVLAFAVFGHIIFAVGIAMAVGQIIGGYLGAKMALKYGIKIIKPLVVAVSFAMCVKLLFFS
ncbi:TSUP family transporter [Helicobacter sp. 23-1044]